MSVLGAAKRWGRVLAGLAAAAAGSQAWAQAPVQVEAFSPQGEARDVRQVTARFSEPMVAFGDPRVESPFAVDCPGTGRARWVDAQHWVYDFDADLPAGLRCSFALRAGLKSAAGLPLAPASFSFSTGGPAVRRAWPGAGDERIDEDQVFLLGLDTPADPASVGAHAACVVSGIGERIPLEILDGAAREQILAQQKDRVRNDFLVITKRGRVGVLAVKDSRLARASIVVARCARRLPPGAVVHLVWGSGLMSASGVPTRQDQTLAYRVRPDFELKAVCTRINPNAGCVPVLPLTLNLSAPVARELATRITLTTAEGGVRHPTLDAKAPTVDAVAFDGPFPANSEVRIDIPAGLQDDAGRAPANAAAFPMQVRIDDDPPLIKFSSRFGILEAHADPALPVSVRNVEATLKGLSARLPQPDPGPGEIARIDAADDRTLLDWLRKVLVSPQEQAANQRRFGLNDQSGQSGQSVPREGELPLLAGHEAEFGAIPLTLPRLDGGGKAGHELELIGIPLPGPGFYVVEFASRRLGAALNGPGKPYYVSASALVTNLGVHFKRGRESSLVWVTRLDNAQPVAGARVQVSDCRGARLWEGQTGADGTARVVADLPNRWDADCRALESGYLVTARKQGDLGFMSTAWHQGISPWEFNLAGGEIGQPLVARTVLDRPLFRAGETVSMKHFLRLHTGDGFSQPATSALPEKVLIEHEGSGQRYEVPVSWGAGAGVSSWAIPKEARLGLYQVRIPFGRSWIESGDFRVEAFRVPLLRATLRPPAAPVVNADAVAVDVQLNYMTGGPDGGAPVKFRSRVVPYPLVFPAYPDFRFDDQVPKEGIQVVEPYAYNPDGEDEDEDETPGGSPDPGTGAALRTRSLTLDAEGGAHVVFDKLPKTAASRALEVEMAYSDPNGQVLNAATRALLLPSSLVLGMKIEGHFATRERLAFKALALGPQGAPLAGRRVAVDAYSRRTYAYRKRQLGGFYAYEQTVEVKRLGRLCAGATDAQGLLACDGAAPASGELLLVARGDDDQGNPATGVASVFVADEDSWSAASPSDRMDLLPDKRSFEPGETARFEVRMPFREATALVTVEREGVLESRVVPLSAKSPYVELKMKDAYGPNVYVSVMAVRGRVDPEVPGPFAWLQGMLYRVGRFFGLVRQLPRPVDTRPTALVDLAKPAFRLGMTEVRVGWGAYTLNVKVDPEKPVYRVREKAAVRIAVTLPDGRPAANAEVALAAVDEGLLALAPARSWDLLEAMMARRPIEVETSTAQSQVIGKRHFGKKAAAPGGGGGAGANARELFDTLLLWKPVVRLDAQGRARVEIPLNDSLTSFRIEAIADAGDGRFGEGGATLRSTQDLMLFAGLPPFVRAGDRFDAMITARNGAGQPLTVDLSATAEGGSAPIDAGTRRITLAAGEAKTIGLPARVPLDARQLRWTLAAQAVGGTAHDALTVTQQVGEAVPVRVVQQTLEQLDPARPWTFAVERPAGALPGRGGIDVSLARSLGGDFDAIRDWMSRYPFDCLEQKASVAIATEDAAAWQRVAGSLTAYLDRDGLARYFPSDRLDGDDTLTAYLLSISQEAGRPIPDPARERMLRGLADFVADRVQRFGSLPTADLAVRKLAAIDALARYGRAEPAMLQTIEIAPALWPSSAVIDWISLLGRMPGIAGRDQHLGEARRILRSRLNFSGTTLGFSTEKQDALWWLMVSPDLNAVRSLLVLADDPSFRDDLPRLARGALGRQTAGRWSTTIANAWGVLALRRFASQFERQPVTGETRVDLGGDSRHLAWPQAAPRDARDPTRGPPPGAGLDAHFDWPGPGAARLSLTHLGGGRPWAFVASRAALPLDTPLFAGYRITRTLTPVTQKTPGVWSVGDVYRVRLDIEAQSDRTWVVVDDPVPAGATVLGSGLGGDSSQLTAGEKNSGWAWPAFDERGFDGYRAFYALLPKGRQRAEYTVRLNNAGDFSLPPSRVEAMYAPEVFGELPVPGMVVKAP